LIDLENPIEIKGSLGAIVTGKLTLQISIGGCQLQRQLILFNEELFEDRENPTVYYRTSGAFSETLGTLFR
jgi:hypothetical protein